MINTFRFASLLLALLLCSTGASAQKSVFVTDATASVVVPAGDVDGDGLPDLLIADPLDDSAGTDAGMVQVLSGADMSVLFTATGDQAGDLFGFSAATVGDLNFDGKHDIVVGAPGIPGSGATGYARLLSGADGSTIFTFVGTQPDGQYGFAVGGSLTLMADNSPGVVIGASAEGTDNSKNGAVYVYSGTNGSLLATLTGADVGDELGSSVAGDAALSLGSTPLMADNSPGVVVGATAGGNDGAGYVLLLRRSDLVASIRIDGDASADRFGGSVALLGDVNGDGLGDVAVGADGYARILSGADGATLQSFATAATDTGFGSSVSWVGDLSEDGIGDIAVSEPGADGNGIDAGRAHIFSGADGSVIHSVNGPAGSGFSGAVAYAGDLDGDGLAEVAIGAPANDNGTEPAGTVYVLSLTRLTVVGEGEAGESGVPELRSEGGVGDLPELVLHLEDARPSATASLVMGSSLVMVNDKVVPTATIVITGLTTDTEGRLEYAFTLPPGLPPGFTLYYQYEVVDPAAENGIARSNTIGAMLP